MKPDPTGNDLPAGAADFSGLTPDAVLACAEEALGVRCASICRPLNSYINRVYEIGLADGGFVIAKFYRPGRWSRDALQDELDFLAELHEAEVPVVPPLAGRTGAFLHTAGDTHYALFPKKGGRPLDEPAPNEWPQLGRLLARLHAVGARHPPRDRVVMHPRHAPAAQVEYLLHSGTIPPEIRRHYERAAAALLDTIAPLFEGVAAHRIHGDCHRGNILHRPGEGFHMIDFDDMAVGPAVQDLWMLLPGRLDEARVELELLLEGYETFMALDRSELRLVEPLRAMRYIHSSAGCARQKADGGFARLAPDWGSPAYWRQEIAELEDQKKIVEEGEA